MKLISWNVNGIRAVHKKGLFVPFIEKYQPDILCLQETKAEQHQSEVDLPEYQEFWNSSTARKGYSGTAIFIKKNISVLGVRLGLPQFMLEEYGFEDDEYGDPNKEGRIISVELDNFFVVTVYTPNSKPDLSRLSLRHDQWDPAFLMYMKFLEEQKPVIFCGDLNVAHTENDLANPKENMGKHGYTNEEREGIDRIVNEGFIDTFRMFTQGNGNYSWWSHFANSRNRNIGWRIDYFFVSKKIKSKIIGALILPYVFGSDHCPTLLELK